MKYDLSIFKKMQSFNYTPLQTMYPTGKSTLYFLLIPATIISIYNNLYTPIALTIVCLLIGYKDIHVFLDFKKLGFKKLLQVSGMLFLTSLFFVIVPLIVMSFFNITDPQGLKDMVLSDKEYIHELLNLPFTAVGEEFFKLLVFISSFILLSQFKMNLRIFLAVLLSSFIFGHLHIFNYKLTAGLPIMLGAIPTYYFMIYYKSILPLIIEHFIFDFLSYTMHSKYQAIILIILTLVAILIMVWPVLKLPFEKMKKNS